MVAATVRELRLNLSRFLRIVERGDQVIVRNRNTPVARIVPYRQAGPSRFPDLTAFRASLRKRLPRQTVPVEQIIRADRDGRG